MAIVDLDDGGSTQCATKGVPDVDGDYQRVRDALPKTFDNDTDLNNVITTFCVLD